MPHGFKGGKIDVQILDWHFFPRLKQVWFGKVVPPPFVGVFQKWLSGNGGGGGIRTHETLARLPVFKTGAFNHSATPPRDGRLKVVKVEVRGTL